MEEITVPYVYTNIKNIKNRLVFMINAFKFRMMIWIPA
jgi:hypothetical protein